MDTDSELYFLGFVAIVGVVCLCMEIIYFTYKRLTEKITIDNDKESLYRELWKLVRVAKKIRKENPEVWEKAERELQLNEEEKVFSGRE